MKIIIKSKNFELTPFLESYVQEKFSGLDKFVSVLKDEGEMGNPPAEIIVELEKETKHHRKGEVFSAEAQAVLPGKTLVVKATCDDMQKAIVEAKDELKMEIEKYKFKKIDNARREQRKSKTEIEK